MKNKLLVAVFALMTFTAMVYAYSWGVANIWYFNASYYLDDWSKAGKIEHADEYQKSVGSDQQIGGVRPITPALFAH